MSKYFLPAILLAPLVLLILFLTSVRVKNVTCQTQYGPCPDSYEEKLSKFLKKPLYKTTSDEIKKSLAGAGGVGQVRLLKHVSGTLEINVEVTKLAVAVQVGDDNKKLWLVNLEGNVVSMASQSSLPKLIVKSGRVSSEDPNFVSAVRLTELLARARKIDSAEIVGQDLTVATEGIQVIMPLVGKGPQVLVGSLQLVLERGTIEGKRLSKIDLRFKNAVVTY